MLQELINHNNDIKQLWEEGYEISFQEGHLVVDNIPYVNTSKQIKYGRIISTLNLSGNNTLKPETHVIHFTGDAPCNKHGLLLNAIINSSSKRNLGQTLGSDHLFSSKPKAGYKDYYEKISTYIEIISAPAISIDPKVTAKTFKINLTNEECVFNYLDTNSTRAGIRNISDKLKNQTIAIVGLGGTGAYILDLVSKNPVDEIHLFDGDYFLQHNAFRAPGAASLDDIKARYHKVEFWNNTYSKIHKGIKCFPHNVDESNPVDFTEYDYVFICVDQGKAKKCIISDLIKNNIPFSDVGMGVQLVDDRLLGTVRVTSGAPNQYDHLYKRISFDDGEPNEYNSNIQIAELNSLNASLAVIKWKKHFNFFHDHEHEFNTSYTVNVNMLLSEDTKS